MTEPQKDEPAFTLDDAIRYVSRQAEGYIAGRDCKFHINAEPDHAHAVTRLTLRFNAPHMSILRRLEFDEAVDDMKELMDVAMVKLTHMAVAVGLIETTPKGATHRIQVVGETWQNTELQLDGHTLRGVFSANFTFEVGEDSTVALTFASSKVHLDKEFLPQHISAELEGMEEVLGLLRDVAEQRAEGFKNEATGEAYGRLHSSDAEVDLFRQVFEALHKYEPSEASAGEVSVSG